MMMSNDFDSSAAMNALKSETATTSAFEPSFSSIAETSAEKSGSSSRCKIRKGFSIYLSFGGKLAAEMPSDAPTGACRKSVESAPHAGGSLRTTDRVRRKSHQSGRKVPRAMDHFCRRRRHNV